MAYQNLNYNTASINNLLYKCDHASSGGSTSGYITSSTMSSTYLTKTSASNTYQVKGSYMTTSNYNSYAWQSEATSFDNTVSGLYNTTDKTLLDHYYPVGSVILTAGGSSTYNPNNKSPLNAGSWTKLEGVIYGDMGSIGSTYGENFVYLTATQTPVAGFSETVNTTADIDPSATHTHKTTNTSYGFLSTDSSIGGIGINGAVPGSQTRYYPRLANNTDFALHSYTAQASCAHTHSASKSLSTAGSSFSVVQATVCIGIWYRTS